VVHQEHADEAAFAWGQWERGLRESDAPLIPFADGIDERLLANQEALATAPRAVLLDGLAAALDGDAEENEVSVWALATLIAGADGPVRKALDTHPRHGAQLQRALELCWSAPASWAAGLRDARSPTAAVACLGMLAAHEHRFGAELDAFLESQDALIATAALRVLPLAAAPDTAWAHANLRSPHAATREAAREAALVLEPARALPELRRSFEARDGLDLVLIALAISGDGDDLARVERALLDPALRRQALWALGFSGRARAAELSVQHLGTPEVADLAAETFEMITGVRLSAGARPAPEDDAEPEEASSTPPSRWGAPPPVADKEYDLNAAQSAWQSWKRAQSALGQRFLRGVPMTGEVLAQSLRSEPMRRRHVRALELHARARSQAHPVARFDTHTWGWRQLRRLDLLEVPSGIACDAPLDRRGR
jgi:uncharacterized protein (TIGR02270 family)